MSLPTILEIEHRDLGGGYVEGFFEIDEIAAFLALQTGLPHETIRARVIEAHGYCQRPPRSGEKVILMQTAIDHVDELAVRAMQRVISDFVSAEEAWAVRSSYLASEYGDAYWIAWDLQVHVYVVIAILRNLQAEGRLPEHPGW